MKHSDKNINDSKNETNLCQCAGACSGNCIQINVSSISKNGKIDNSQNLSASYLESLRLSPEEKPTKKARKNYKFFKTLNL